MDAGHGALVLTAVLFALQVVGAAPVADWVGSEPDVRIVAPEQGSTTNGTVTVEGTADLGDASHQGVMVRVDGGPWVEIQAVDDWRWTWDTRLHADGPHTIDARAFEGDRISQTVERSVTVDNGDPPPRVTIDEPAPGAHVNGTVTVDGSAADPEGQISRVEVRVEGGAWQPTRGTDNWTYTWDTTTSGDGFRVVEARALDASGFADHTMRIVQVANQADQAPPDADRNRAPTINLTSPGDGERVSGSLGIEGSASDPDPEDDHVTVESRVDWGRWRHTVVRSGQPFHVHHGTGGLEPGDHVLTVRASDGDAFTVVERRVTVYGGGAPSSDGSLWDPGSPWIAGPGAVLALGGLVAGGLYWRTRR